MSPEGSSASSSTPDEDSVDVGFARDMSVHHQQAVEMSFLVRDNTDDEDVRLLAFDIINTQANQRGMMLGWLEVWDMPKSTSTPMEWMPGHSMPDHEGMDGMEDMDGAAALMPGMATDEDIEELTAAEGRAAEVLFLELMIEHHQGGVEMARAAADAASTEEVERLAGGMVEAQASEIDLMNDMLAARGA
ncbi:DUF305 domain-containing protein [Streptomyces radicis]|uniref:DUF305 domain-containing protein n=2 Tax=Streptomyces radicis TaxID=1750517 RepID=A0A3A9W7X6_9ACTN|nr:DUF305 domain-containing protein [Streptomyces radicis]RKN05414.1 DUF305 domain-containing protein [Streptomyces radicis]RKN16921.1 DUF305 domain-containing protein [Streptomyces radicis]